MSKTSKHCRKAKEEFNKSLEKIIKDEIDYVVSGHYNIEQEIEDQERYEREQYSIYDQEMYELSLLDDSDDDDYYRYEDVADEYDIYETDYLYDDYRDDWYVDSLSYDFSSVGKYFKQNEKTYLCCEVNGRVVYVDVHTGRQLSYTYGLKRVE